MACYVGPIGSTRPCGSSKADGRSASFATTGLGPHEGLTVVVGFPTGAVPTPRPILEERSSLAQAFSATPATLTMAGGVLLAMLLVLGWLFGRRTAPPHHWLRAYLQPAGVDRADPAQAADQFSPYLPYAIKFGLTEFGLTEQWTRTFELVGAPPKTPWFESHRPYTPHRFRNRIHRFSSSSAAILTATPPAVSGSSGFGSGGSGSSGGGGGGFSGGGGGGGGGGSW